LNKLILILIYGLFKNTVVDHSPPSSAKVKKCGAIPPFSHMSSWLSAYLIKHGDNFIFLSVPQNIQQQIIGLMNYELERIWKETVQTYFHVQSQKSPGGTDKISAKTVSAHAKIQTSYFPSPIRGFIA
jgi:hypothetical protein